MTLTEAAARLFTGLRWLDAEGTRRGLRGIAVLGTIEDLAEIVADFERRKTPITRLVMMPSAFEDAALPESTSGNRGMVYQWALDYVADAYRLGYLGLRGRPQAGATVDRNVVYDNLYANWMGEKTTVYLAYVHSNNNTATAVSNNAGTILGNVGGVNAGTNADLHNFYNIVQLSADYKLTPQLRLGALVGRIADQSHRDRGANGAAVTAYYDLSKRTMLLGQVETLRNDSAGGWRPAGSAGLKDTFTQAADINGRTISGVQLGIVHRF